MSINLRRGIASAVLAICMGFSGNAPALAGSHELSDAVKAAVDNQARSAADRARDAGRQPGKVLDFIGIKSGMTVLDVFSGGGYYAELMSHVVGADGKVIAHNSQGSLAYVGDEVKARYADGRLANVGNLLADANDLDAGDGMADAALLILGFHDIFYVSAENPEALPGIDPAVFLGNIKRAMKPGAVFGLIDHSAAAGSTSETGATLHRISEAIVREQMAAAGFEFIGEADFLRNPDDARDLGVFDPAIQGKTDRFLHLYRKPE